MQAQKSETAEVLLERRQKKTLAQVFWHLKKKWVAENFRQKKESEMAQIIIYQWSVFVKLKKINGRYNI